MSRHASVKSLHSDKFFIDGLHNASLRSLSWFWSMKIICRTFNRILTMMATDWEKCSSTKFSKFAMTCNAKLSQRFANMMMVFYTTAVILYSSKILLKQTDVVKASNVSRSLILDMDLPFDTNRKFVYELVTIAQFLHLLLCSDANGLLNALLINLVSPVVQKNIVIVIIITYYFY